jgi:hypothetical protein
VSTKINKIFNWNTNFKHWKCTRLVCKGDNDTKLRQWLDSCIEYMLSGVSTSAFDADGRCTYIYISENMMKVVNCTCYYVLLRGVFSNIRHCSSDVYCRSVSKACGWQAASWVQLAASFCCFSCLSLRPSIWGRYVPPKLRAVWTVRSHNIGDSSLQVFPLTSRFLFHTVTTELH